MLRAHSAGRVSHAERGSPGARTFLLIGFGGAVGLAKQIRVVLPGRGSRWMVGPEHLFLNGKGAWKSGSATEYSELITLQHGQMVESFGQHGMLGSQCFLLDRPRPLEEGLGLVFLAPDAGQARPSRPMFPRAAGGQVQAPFAGSRRPGSEAPRPRQTCPGACKAPPGC